MKKVFLFFILILIINSVSANLANDHIFRHSSEPSCNKEIFYIYSDYNGWDNQNLIVDLDLTYSSGLDLVSGKTSVKDFLHYDSSEYTPYVHKWGFECSKKGSYYFELKIKSSQEEILRNLTLDLSEESPEEQDKRENSKSSSSSSSNSDDNSQQNDPIPNEAEEIKDNTETKTIDYGSTRTNEGKADNSKIIEKTEDKTIQTVSKSRKKPSMVKYIVITLFVALVFSLISAWFITGRSRY